MSFTEFVSNTTLNIDTDLAREFFGGEAAPEPEPTPMEGETLVSSAKAQANPFVRADNGTSHTQWAAGPNNSFLPIGSSLTKLPAGVYSPTVIGNAIGLELMKIQSDSIYQLPDMATIEVLGEVDKFWKSEPKYRANDLLFKRGLILYGPPGGGKTCTLKLLMEDLIANDGVVVIVNNVTVAGFAIKALRRVEPTRNLIVVFEDIDEIIRFSSEAQVLSMLDGEDNVDRVLFLATTNYIDTLSARIVNRPSRFDRRIFVGMPSLEARMAYLQKKTNGGLDPALLVQWAGDTDGLSIAHLKELVVSVYCLEQPYEDVITRLKSMATPLKSESGFKESKAGFLGVRSSGA